ncbi:MAG TPA: nicotinic acid mononucleotide adenylyltransferase [Dysgonomonas sp.]|nr:nicotinic acid mononucleotide adenylyltransferase [Dysgonomonas sp.]
MNIGIFSGSFNPIHIGHLILVNYITEYSELDEVWLLVTPQNPFKEEDDLLDEEIRLKMTELALKDYPKVKLSNIEFSLPRPSYTINTLEELEKKYPEDTFSLIIGADNWERFDQWKDSEDILANYKIYVYPRYGYSVSRENRLKKSVEILNSPIVEISSTFIREGIKEGHDLKAFMPEVVYKYIKEHNLYQ